MPARKRVTRTRIDRVGINEMMRRVDGLVSEVATDKTYGKALYRQFDQHCLDDERRHGENVVRLAAIEAQGERATAAVNRLTEQLAGMTPTFRRLRAKQATRRAIVQCLSRWKGILVGLGIAAGGLFVWVDGHGPRIVAWWKWIFGVALVALFAEPFSPAFLRLVLAACAAIGIALVVDGGAVL